MNKVNLNTISLNEIPINIVGEIRGDNGGNNGGEDAPIEKPIGVFIYTTDGEFIPSDAWDSANNDKVVGVFVNDGEHDFVIAKENASASLLKWGGANKKITSISTVTSEDNAKLDFDGASNTTNIIEELKGYTDSVGILGAPACEACANYKFINGNKGYLPSIGELNLAYVNKTAIDNAIAKCDGINMLGYHWSSSQSGLGSWVFHWGYGYINNYDRGNNSCRVRAFCKI